MPILVSKMLFVCEKLLDKKFFSSFSRKFGYLLSKKDLEIKSDPFRSDPWFYGSTIRSRSSRRKWICDPIMILKKEDLDPKGSRSDHNRHISGYNLSRTKVIIEVLRKSIIAVYFYSKSKICQEIKSWKCLKILNLIL